MEPYGVIYKVVSIDTGKAYIGQTIQGVDKRWAGHKSGAKKYKDKEHRGCVALYRAIRKYGAERFEVFQLAEADNKDELNSLEVMYIEKYNTIVPNGYNIEHGGAARGKVHVSTKKKISKKIKALWRDDEYRTHMSSVHKGYKCDRDTIQKRAESMRKAHELRTPEQRADTAKKLSLANKRVLAERGSDIIAKRKATYFSKPKSEREAARKRAVQKSLETKRKWSDEQRAEYLKKQQDYWTEEERNRVSVQNGVEVRNIETGEVYCSAQKAAVAIGKAAGAGSNILACCDGRQKTAYGYRWERVYPKGYKDGGDDNNDREK